MSDLRIRTITGLGIGIVTIGAVLGGPFTLGIFIFLLGLGINHEVYRLFVRDRTSTQALLYSILATLPLIIGLLDRFGIIEMYWILLFYISPVLITMSYFFFIRHSNDHQSQLIRAFAFSTLYVSGGLLGALLLGWPDGTYSGKLILGIMILIWTNDSFAYFTGRKWGKTPLAAHISPKKTWEGTIGGGLFTLLAGGVFGYFSKTETLFFWIVTGILVAIFSNIGDLLQSSIKRSVGVKDSGNLLPGHGGLFDRYDSFVCVLPVIAVFYFLTHPFSL